MKKSIIISLALLAFISIILIITINFINSDKQNLSNEIEKSAEIIPVEESEEETLKPGPLVPEMRADNFSGVLEQVNVGCFVDGECYVVVDGKHITTTIGWSNNVVGTIIGAGSIGELENLIGERVEVYAQDLSGGIYSLYGSEEFYIKLLNAGSASTRIGETTNILKVEITPVEVLEDSRCQIDVQCIQAGTVRLRTTVESNLGKSEQIFVLGESVKTEAETITMVAVDPVTDSKTTISESEYAFVFKVTKNN